LPPAGVCVSPCSFECVKTIVVDNKERVIASLRQTLNMVQTLDAAHGNGGSGGDEAGTGASVVSPTAAQSASVSRWPRALAKVRIALKLPFLTAQAIQEYAASGTSAPLAFPHY
jgi:hypothetical protein